MLGPFCSLVNEKQQLAFYHFLRFAIYPKQAGTKLTPLALILATVISGHAAYLCPSANARASLTFVAF